MSNNTNIGIMAGAYFVSRSDLLAWLNTTLEINYQKVEQVSNGAAFCQILDSIFYSPSAKSTAKIPLGKVKFNARTHDEIMTNYKILQSSFTRLGIKKVVDIERLRQGRFQDNLEFLQWLKRYYDIKASHDTAYPARERRRATGCAEPTFQNGGLPGGSVGGAGGHVRRGSVPSSGRSSMMPSPTESMNPSMASTPLPMQVEEEEEEDDEMMGIEEGGVRGTAGEMMMGTTRRDDGFYGVNESGGMDARMMHAETVHMTEVVSSLENEKDYYYNRLFEIEMLCREVNEDAVHHKGYNAKTLAEAIKVILYKDNN